MSDSLPPEDLERLQQWEARCLRAFRSREPLPTLPDAAQLGLELHRQFKDVLDVYRALDQAQREQGGLIQLAGFEVRKEIGRGGMGVVYEAYEQTAKRPVALKKIFGGGALARSRVEIQATAQMNHPNIVQLYDYREIGNDIILILELVQGGSLSQRLRSGLDAQPVPMTPRAAALLVQTLAGAIQYAHDKRVLHRDLKPANVLLAGPRDAPIGHCQPKITDFGLARSLDPEATRLTNSGELLGTISYMAPEQVTGDSQRLGAWTDVYGLGAILYECLVGKPPFEADDVRELLRQVELDDPAPPRRQRPDTPLDLQVICLKCLAKEPEGRYPTAQALAADLQCLLEGKPITARPVGRLQQLELWTRRHPWRAATYLTVAGLVALVILVGGIGAGMTWHSRRDANAALITARRLLRRTLDSPLVHNLNLLFSASQTLSAYAEDLQTAAALYEYFLQNFAGDAAVHEELADIYLRLACVEALYGDKVQALALTEKARTLFARLASELPGIPVYRAKLANATNDLSRVYFLQNRLDEVLPTCRQALRMREGLVKDFGAKYSDQLATDWAQLGEFLRQQGQLQEAAAAFGAALKCYQNYLEVGPAHEYWRSQQAGYLQQRGEALAMLGSMAEAEGAFAQALTLLDQWFDPEGPDPAWVGLAINRLAAPLPGRVEGLAQLLVYAQGSPSRSRAPAFYAQLLLKRPDDMVCRHRLARSLFYEGMEAFSARDKGAVDIVLRAATLYDDLLAVKPQDRRYLLEVTQLSLTTVEMIHLHNIYRPTQDMGWWIEKAQKALATLSTIDGDIDTPRGLRSAFHYIRALLLLEQDHVIEALQDLRRVCLLEPTVPHHMAELYAATVARARLQMITLLRRAQYQQAVVMACGASAIPGIPGEALYDAACVLSLTSVEVAKWKTMHSTINAIQVLFLSGVADNRVSTCLNIVMGGAAADVIVAHLPERFASRSVECLRQAFAAGFGKDRIQKASGIFGDPVLHIERDPDLIPVCGRWDYQHLVVVLRALQEPISLR